MPAVVERTAERCCRRSDDGHRGELTLIWLRFLHAFGRGGQPLHADLDHVRRDGREAQSQFLIAAREVEGLASDEGDAFAQGLHQQHTGGRATSHSTPQVEAPTGSVDAHRHRMSCERLEHCVAASPVLKTDAVEVPAE